MKMNRKECIFAFTATLNNFIDAQKQRKYYKLFPCHSFGAKLVTSLFPSAGVFYFTYFKTATK